MYLRTIAVAILLHIATVVAQQQLPSTTPTEKGTINWATHAINAIGIGVPNPDLPASAAQPAALRIAKQLAIRDALESIQGILINSSTSVKNNMLENEAVATSIQSFVARFEQEGKSRNINNGSVEVTMQLPINGTGGLLELILANSISNQPAISRFEGAKDTKEQAFTGFIINGKGLGIKPALSPRLLDETGREVYGSAYVSREWAIAQGIVGYTTDGAAAKKLVDRIGNAPGLIKGIKTHGQNSTDVVITNEDARVIRSTLKNLTILAECRVIFIID